LIEIDKSMNDDIKVLLSPSIVIIDEIKEKANGSVPKIVKETRVQQTMKFFLRTAQCFHQCS
jgi:hypothetical protein